MASTNQSRTVFPHPRTKPLLTIAEAQAVLGTGRDATYQAARAGELPVVVVGGRTYVSTARLAAQLGITFAEPADTPPAA